MARKPKTAKKATASSPTTDNLAAALDFVKKAIRNRTLPYTNYFKLANKTLIGYDGIIAAGAIIDEDLNACPHIDQLSEAVRYCTTASSLTQVDAHRLKVIGTKFRGNIQCLDPMEFPQDIWPDTPKIAVGPDLVKMLSYVGKLATTTSERIIQCSVMLTDGVCAATDGAMAIQSFHPYNFNGTILSIPKIFIQSIESIQKTPVYAGWSNHTFTIFYSDNSWYRTNLYDVRWPPIDAIFTKSNNIQWFDLPQDLATGVEAISTFVENNTVYIDDNIVSSHPNPEAGAFYALNGIIGTFKTGYRHLVLLAKLNLTHCAIYDEANDGVMFAGGTLDETINVRVAISEMV